MKEEIQKTKGKSKEPIPTVEERETRAVLVAVIRDSQNPDTAQEYLDELEFLAETANIKSVKRFTQRLPQPLSKIYVGPGKLEEIALWCKEQEIDVAIFDDELSPAQTRNIEQAMPCRIMDRTRLILDIFSDDDDGVSDFLYLLNYFATRSYNSADAVFRDIYFLDAWYAFFIVFSWLCYCLSHLAENVHTTCSCLFQSFCQDFV